MIELYTWKTPNGRKASIMLEETGLPYRVHPIDLSKNQQLEPDFLKVNPNNKIPAITDPDGPDGQPLTLFESGAILIYLAEKAGKLLPADPRGRLIALQWLMWQMGGLGPMLGQLGHFRRAAPEQIPYAIKRFDDEAARLYRVLDQRLGEAEFLAGADYSIADIATWPWVAAHPFQGIDIDRYTNVRRWYDTIAARPAVQRGKTVPS
jgi:GST-like protein